MGNQDTKIQFTAQGLQEIKASAISLLREMVTLNEAYNKSNQLSLQTLREQVILLREQKRILSSTAFTGKGAGAALVGGGGSTTIVNAIELSRANAAVNGDILLLQVKKITGILEAYLGVSGAGIVAGGGRRGGDDSGGEDEGSGEVGSGGSGRRRRSGGRVMWTKDIYSLMDHVSSAAKSDDYASTYLGMGKTLGASAMGMFEGAGAAVGIPVLAGSIGAEVLLDLYEKRQKAGRGNVQLFGGTISGQANLNRNGGREFEKYGYGYLDVLGERESLSKAYGKQVSNQQIGDAFQLQRGAGFDISTTGSLLRLLRSSTDKNLSIAGITQGVVGAQGLGSDWSTLDEHVQLLVGLSEQQVQEYGKTNIILNNQILGGISKLSDDFKNPIVLGQVAQKFMSGSQQSQTPQFQALQYRTAEEVAKGHKMKNFDIKDLTKIIQDPTSKYFGEFMEKLINNIYKNLGKDQAEWLLKSPQFNFSWHQVGDISEAWDKGKSHVSMLEINKIKDSGGLELQKREEKAPTSGEKRMAQTQNDKGELFDIAKLDQAAESIAASLKTLDILVMKFSKALSNSIADLRDWKILKF